MTLTTSNTCVGELDQVHECRSGEGSAGQWYETWSLYTGKDASLEVVPLMSKVGLRPGCFLSCLSSPVRRRDDYRIIDRFHLAHKSRSGSLAPLVFSVSLTSLPRFLMLTVLAAGAAESRGVVNHQNQSPTAVRERIRAKPAGTFWIVLRKFSSKSVTTKSLVIHDTHFSDRLHRACSTARFRPLRSIFCHPRTSDIETGSSSSLKALLPRPTYWKRKHPNPLHMSNETPTEGWTGSMLRAVSTFSHTSLDLPSTKSRLHHLGC